MEKKNAMILNHGTFTNKERMYIKRCTGYPVHPNYRQSHGHHQIQMKVASLMTH